MLLALASVSLGVLVAPASAAEIVDRNVSSPQLRVNAKGDVALVTYRVQGQLRHVLYWGARNWAGTFQRDYSGGWKSKVAELEALPEPLRALQRPRDRAGRSRAATRPTARTGRCRPGRASGRTTAATRRPVELYISHWTGDIGHPDQVQTDWGYHGKHEHLWGNFQFHGKPVYGNSWTLPGRSDRQAGAATSTSTTRSTAPGSARTRS